MAFFIYDQYDACPMDRDGNLISIGKTVYLSAGWDKENKSLPFEKGLVVGISFISGRHYLVLEGCSMQQVAARLVCSRDSTPYCRRREYGSAPRQPSDGGRIDASERDQG